MLNTIKTTFRFLYAAVRRSAGTGRAGTMEDIMNVINYSDRLSSSGQPTKKQFALIRDAGYETVVNLAPYEFIENPLKNEAGIVTGLGMTYHHIPVDFFNPTDKDFDRFTEIMQAESDRNVWVHCAANARGSAFVYRYRCEVLGEDSQDAIWDLREIWEPFGVWKKFISSK